MGLFDKINQHSKEKAIDRSIEEVKQHIAAKDYGEARYILDILKDPYRQDEIQKLKKKAYPVEVKTLASLEETAYESGYRSSRFTGGLKADEKVMDNCTQGCSYIAEDGSRSFCRIREHEKFKALVNDFEDYWGGRVFFVIEDTNKVYILAVEADKELWTYDRVMAYCAENGNVKDAVYAEIKLDLENGIPVIQRYTPEHKKEKDEYIERVKSCFGAQWYREVIKLVRYMDEHLFSDYRAEDMEEVYRLYNKSIDFVHKLETEQKA